MEGKGVPQEPRGLSALFGLWLCRTPQVALKQEGGWFYGELCVFVCILYRLCKIIYASFPTCQQHRDNKVLLLVHRLSTGYSPWYSLNQTIYTMIVETMLAAHWPADHDTKLAQRQCLARMMQVSKVGLNSQAITLRRSQAGLVTNVAQLYIESGRKLRLVLRSGLLGTGSVV